MVDKKTGEKSKTRPRFVKQDQVAIMRIECAGVICLEQFKLFPQMGRFTLRDESTFRTEGANLNLIFFFFPLQIKQSPSAKSLKLSNRLRLVRV